MKFGKTLLLRPRELRIKIDLKKHVISIKLPKKMSNNNAPLDSGKLIRRMIWGGAHF
jgi:hypothetical protein